MKHQRLAVLLMALFCACASASDDCDSNLHAQVVRILQMALERRILTAETLAQWLHSSQWSNPFVHAKFSSEAMRYKRIFAEHERNLTSEQRTRIKAELERALVKLRGELNVAREARDMTRFVLAPKVLRAESGFTATGSYNVEMEYQGRPVLIRPLAVHGHDLYPHIFDPLNPDPTKRLIECHIPVPTYGTLTPVTFIQDGETYTAEPIAPAPGKMAIVIKNARGEQVQELKRRSTHEKEEFFHPLVVRFSGQTWLVSRLAEFLSSAYEADVNLMFFNALTGEVRLRRVKLNAFAPAGLVQYVNLAKFKFRATDHLLWAERGNLVVLDLEANEVLRFPAQIYGPEYVSVAQVNGHPYALIGGHRQNYLVQIESDK